MRFSKSDLCERSMPYLRPSVAHVEPDVVVRGSNAPLLKDLGNGLLVSYVIDIGDHLQYVQNRHLEASGTTESELDRHAVHNLAVLAREKLLIKSHGDIFAVLLDGNFEASLILVDDLWDKSLVLKVTSSFVVAIPARDILAFCDVGSLAGIAELRHVVERANKGGDHLLTPDLYWRNQGKWTVLNRT